MDVFGNSGAIWIGEERGFFIVGGRNKKNEAQSQAYLYSPYYPDTVETLQKTRLKREKCSAVMLQSDIHVKPIQGAPNNSKILVAGGNLDGKLSSYQSSCEVFDLQFDAWRLSSRLKVDRIMPLLAPVGLESVLVIGGMKALQKGSQITLTPVK